jgi:dTDP-4-amino-4,6-dideoxygalactose transaminase
VEKITWWNLNLGDGPLKDMTSSYLEKKLSYGSIGLDLELRLSSFLKINYVTLTTSGSVALLMALKALGIKPDDEIIIPNRTFQATANAGYFLNANVKLVDVDPQTGLMDLTKIEEKITNKTKAIIAVHLNGQCVDISKIITIINGRSIFIVEDVAQAFGSKLNGHYAGTMGDIGCFSMGVTKFLTTGQGGFVVTNNQRINKKIKKLIFHSQEGIDDKTFNDPGFNFRFPDLLASLALSQLKDFETKKNKFKQTYINYEKELSKIEYLKINKILDLNSQTPIWIEIFSTKRDELFQFLKSNNIESVKFYPSLNKAPYLKIGNEEHFTSSEYFENQGIILPCGPDIELSKISKVIECLRQFEQENF